MLGSIFLVSGDLIGKSFLSGLQSGLFGIINYLVVGFFLVGEGWSLNKSDGVLRSEFLVGGNLIGESFLSCLQSSLLGIINYLVVGLFLIRKTWGSNLNKRCGFWCSWGSFWSSGWCGISFWSSSWSGISFWGSCSILGIVFLSILLLFDFFLGWSISFSGFFLSFSWFSRSQLSVSTIGITIWLRNNLGDPVLVP